MSRSQLVEMTRHVIEHSKAGTIEQEPDVFRVPVSDYYDPDRWRLEVDRIFKRLPLMLALSSELAAPGDYKSMEAAGVPVLMTRGEDGQVRAFVNMCSHRGAIVVQEGRGNTQRFTCPYHAWTYDGDGRLLAVFAAKDFGDVDLACHGLTSLPVAERAGLIWVILKPESKLDIDRFLCGYDELLGHFGFETWHVVSRAKVDGPNWKIAYDGYLDLYHLPILHKETFGPKMPHQALYYSWGPHQRVNAPNPMMPGLEKLPEEQWPDEVLMAGVWTIFPHISIASFDAGGRGVLISQLFPGDGPLESVTIQNYVMDHEPTDAEMEEAQKQIDLLEYVVRVEDYATGVRQQKALLTGAKSHVMFGRNEGGGHRFHGWVERLLGLEDDDLDGVFGSERA